MKIFLSLGFSGRSKEEVLVDISLAMVRISDIHNNELLQFVHNYDYCSENRVECLGEAIKQMSGCDKVYFINNWVEHNGCLIEKKVCELYNIPHELITI